MKWFRRRPSRRNLYGALPGRKWRWFPPIMILTVIAAGFLLSTFALYIVPPRAGMAPAIEQGDWVVAVEYGMIEEPEFQRGDVVIFHVPGAPQSRAVSRIIGLPDDRIRIVNRQVYVNDMPVEEPYKQHAGRERNDYRDNFPARPIEKMEEPLREMLDDHVRDGEVVVPSGRCFLLGDDRDVAFDSRHFGLVPFGDIFGRPARILFSYGPKRPELSDVAAAVATPVEAESQPSTPFEAAEAAAPVEAGEAPPTSQGVRWERIFQPIRPYRFKGL